MIAIDTDQYFEAVCRLLSTCRGRDRAITIEAITERIGIHHRRVTEDLLETRLQDFPFLLIAGPRGYYIPTTAKDVNTYVHSLHSRHSKLQLRENTVQTKAVAAGFRKEGDVFVDPPGHQPELFA